MTGLLDCNNFFVSCERVFNPRLRNRPVAVLSNNDGCIVALSNEAKALGLKRGQPYFKVRQLCDSKGVTVLSGNHRLYGDLSNRVMTTIAAVAADIHVYSVDECFVSFTSGKADECVAQSREIVRRVRRHVGIPTSVGIAPTKTLAKTAARFAKNFPAYRCVCAIDNEYRRRRALELTPLSDIWGIGRRLSARLADYGMKMAIDLADKPLAEVDRILNITGIRTWRELNGQACISNDIACDHDDVPQKQMCASRSFRDMITDLEGMNEAVSLFATIISRRMREHSLAARGVSVFIQTNTRRDDLPQYCNSAHIPLAEPANDTLSIATCAREALHAIFRKGFAYKRAGIFITELCSAAAIQQSLFTDPAERLRRNRLMKAVDSLNASSATHDRVHIASYMPVESIARCEMRSPDFSTRMSDIITVNTF